MFKALALVLLASGLHATVNDSTPVQVLDAGLHGPALVPQGTPVYALNNALTGVASSAIDLSGTAGLWVSITSTGAAKVTAFFSNSAVSSTGGAVSSYTWNSIGAYPVEPKARYVSFYNSSNQAGNRVSVNYYPVVSAVGSVNATFSNGTVTAYEGGSWTTTSNQGTSLPGGFYANDWIVNDRYTSGYLTSTAAGTAGRGGSYTAVALTTAYSMNITFAAGINAPCIVTIYPGNSTPTAMYWNSMPAWLAPTTPVNVSSTPIMFTAGIGDFLNLSVTAATAPVTLQVRYAPIY